VKYFCNARNTILYIQDIKIINVFHDKVSDIKTVEDIVMKKPKTMVDLLAVADIYIEAFEAWALLLESRDKGPTKKKQDD
jgi:fructose 1,6-bisphosphatase